MEMYTPLDFFLVFRLWRYKLLSIDCFSRTVYSTSKYKRIVLDRPIGFVLRAVYNWSWAGTGSIEYFWPTDWKEPFLFDNVALAGSEYPKKRLRSRIIIGTQRNKVIIGKRFHVAKMNFCADLVCRVRNSRFLQDFRTGLYRKAKDSGSQWKADQNQQSGHTISF